MAQESSCSHISAVKGVVVGLTGCTALYLICKKFLQKKPLLLLPALRGPEIYESTKAVDEYLLMHYGTASTLMPWSFGPANCLEFPKRCSELCMKYVFTTNRGKQGPEPGATTTRNIRALDVGCAVGRSSFELAPGFDEVIGIDFSQAFVDAANAMKIKGRMTYSALEEGQYFSQHIAEVPSNLDRSRVSFEQGDACNIRSNIGMFDCVLAANLICRLPEPCKFLQRLKSLVRPGGVVVITSPYTFMDIYTPKDMWLGGYNDEANQVVRAIDTLKKNLLPHFELVESIDMPFLIRETARKNQWTVSHGTVWRRRLQ